MPKVSVIVPTYNRADMIGAAIQSVLDQMFSDWELIIVDDGSRDNTKEIVAQWTDPRIHYIYQENKGLPGARNTGIENSHGRYVAFLDSDDLFLTNKLADQAAGLDRNPDLGLVASGYFEVDRHLNVLREVRPWQSHPKLDLAAWVLSCPVIVNSVLVRHEWLERAGQFDEEMRYVEDWDLWLRMSYLGCRMDWLQKPVCYYRFHGKNMARQAMPMKVGMLTMFDKLYAHTDLPAEILALRDPAYAHAYLNAAARALAANAAAEGRECLANAVRLDATLLKGKPPKMLNSLASFALSPLCDNGEQFMDRVTDCLPQPIGRLSKRQARGLLHAVAAFEHYQKQDRKRVLQETFAALSFDPSWLRNRGLITNAGRALLKVM